MWKRYIKVTQPSPDGRDRDLKKIGDQYPRLRLEKVFETEIETK